MLILAFETSAKTASVALTENGKLLGESYQNTGLTHSQTLMVMAEDLLKQCGKTVNDITAVAVAEGPGSFTFFFVHSFKINERVFNSRLFNVFYFNRLEKTCRNYSWHNVPAKHRCRFSQFDCIVIVFHTKTH